MANKSQQEHICYVSNINGVLKCNQCDFTITVTDIKVTAV